MRIAEKVVLGILPLRMHDLDHDLDYRRVIWCGRAELTTTADRPDPHIRLVDGTEGDLLGATWWKNNRAGAGSAISSDQTQNQDSGVRKFSAWSFAWPSVVDAVVKMASEISDLSPLPDPDESTITAEEEEEEEEPSDGWVAILPILQRDHKADKRFQKKLPALPEFAGRYPKGWTGTAISGSEEHSQEDLWLPSALGLVAANQGYFDLGSRVYEVDKKDGIQYWARLQSAWRVVRPREATHVPWSSSGTDNALAWQLGPSEAGDTVAGYGLVVQPEAGGASQPLADPDPDVDYEQTQERGLPEASFEEPDSTTTVDTAPAAPLRIGCASARAGGPLEVGSECAHRRGSTEDGEDIQALHLHYRFLLYGDGIDHGLDIQPVDEPLKVFTPLGIPYRVYCRVDADAKHVSPDGESAPKLQRWFMFLPLGPDLPEDEWRGEENYQPPKLVNPKVLEGRGTLTTWNDLSVPAIMGRPQPVTLENIRDIRSGAATEEEIQQARERPLVGGIHFVRDETTEHPAPVQGSRMRSAPGKGGCLDGRALLLPPEVGPEDYDTDYQPEGVSSSEFGLVLPGISQGVEHGTWDPTLAKTVSGFRQYLPSSSELRVQYLDSAGAAAHISSITTKASLQAELPLWIKDQGATPSSPDAGYDALYIDGSRLYSLNSSGEPRKYRLFKGCRIEHASDWTITYNPATRQFTVTATDAEADFLGVHLHFTFAAEVTSAHANTTESYVLYLEADGSLGVEVWTNEIITSTTKALLATCYYNATDGFGVGFGALHQDDISPYSHLQLYLQGARYDSGFAISGYTLDTNGSAAQQVAVASGKFVNGGLIDSVPALSAGSYTCVYRVNADANGEWLGQGSLADPQINSGVGGDIYWNELSGGTWGLTTVSNLYYVNYFMVAVQALAAPYHYLLMGQAEYSTLEEAESESIQALRWGSYQLADGIQPLYRITFQRRSTYTDPGNSRIQAVAAIYDTSISSASISYTGPSPIKEFTTDEFRLLDPTDTTKKQAHDVSAYTTATTRTMTWPDQDLDMTPGTGDFAASGAGSTLPADDTTSIVRDPADNTKQMRIDVGAVAASTVRVLTVPNQDVDLTPNTGTYPGATHASRHQHGGADEVASATAGPNVIPKADGTGRLSNLFFPAASTTAVGVVELATTAETTTGTDSTRVVTPAGLAGSDYAVREVVTVPTALESGQVYQELEDTEVCRMPLRVPAEAKTILSVVVRAIPDTTNASADVQYYASYGGIGENVNQHSSSTALNSENLTQDQFVELDVTAVTGSLAAGDQGYVTVTWGEAGEKLHVYSLSVSYR
jgi:hypothetical protein